MTKLDINTTPRKAQRGEILTFLKTVAEIPKEDLPDTCIFWPFCINRYTGYGICSHGSGAAHREILVLREGKIPKGLIVRHKCRNRHCFNPKHLEIGTYSDNNNKDRIRDGTDIRGELTKRSVLTESLARQAHKMRKKGIRVEDIAVKLKVTPAAVRQLCIGASWKHLGLEPLNNRKRGKSV